ncbi:hypothetical protein [Acaryochloris sp. 'Moss Beach']|nr:hypothetical protein [Acaryochloris sp. 'Moss Beach']
MQDQKHTQADGRPPRQARCTSKQPLSKSEVGMKYGRLPSYQL